MYLIKINTTIIIFPGLYDMTMLRFSPAQRVGEHLFQRGDGTLSYFFSQEVLRDLFTQEGFVEVSCMFSFHVDIFEIH